MSKRIVSIRMLGNGPYGLNVFYEDGSCDYFEDVELLSSEVKCSSPSITVERIDFNCDFVKPINVIDPDEEEEDCGFKGTGWDNEGDDELPPGLM